ncbi:MAG TPA: tetratricopeptide repeat protein, partial [Puia sp.]|nr:tetratricopeptide repeat protein [Puia sp.]
MKFWSLLLFATVLTSSVSAQKTKLINSRELIERGIQLNDSGQYKEAIAVYNQVDRNDTNYVWSLYEKAVSCTSDSQYNQAIKYCEEGLALRSEREHEAELFNQYGNVLNDAGQSQKALIVFDSAIKKYPSFSLLYFNKGIVYV